MGLARRLNETESGPPVAWSRSHSHLWKVAAALSDTQTPSPRGVRPEKAGSRMDFDIEKRVGERVGLRLDRAPV